MYLLLTRLSDNGIQTLGTLEMKSVLGATVFKLNTLELPYLDNEKQVSCIPPGGYIVNPYLSFRFGKSFEVENVPHRSGILFHAGNYRSNTKGCILVGMANQDLDRDGFLDIVRSRDAMAIMLRNIKGSIPMFINNKF